MTYRTFLLFLVLILGLGSLPSDAIAQAVDQPFSFNIMAHTLPQVKHGDVAWGDYDNDGDLDVLISGLDEDLFSSDIITAIYRNDGVSGDTLRLVNIQAGLDPVLYSRVAWMDYDGDLDLDLVIQGSQTSTRPYAPVTRLYRNDDGAFVEQTGVSLPGLHSGAVSWADYDNDGDPDLLLAGEGSDGTAQTVIYRNDGGGSFSEIDPGFVGVVYGDAQWGDHDNDGDHDLALAGISDQGLVTQIYTNNGGGNFDGQALDALSFPAIDWGDYDGDGRLDLLIAGGYLSPFGFDGRTRLYRNTGSAFVEETTPFNGVLSGGATWGDYDNDGDLDAFVMGAEQGIGSRIAHVYENEGDGDFVLTSLLPGGLFGAVDWGDFDADGDLDLLTIGFDDGIGFTNVYENVRHVRPPIPGAPSQLNASVELQRVQFSWSAPQESEVATFNLRVGTEPGGADVVAPMADPYSGRRLFGRPGNMQHHTQWMLQNLPLGTYYWSVQTLNHAFEASAFASEAQFTISATATDVASETLPQKLALYPNYPNPFHSQTTIRYDLPRHMGVRLTVYNVLGQEVLVLRQQDQEAGTHTVEWDGRDAAGRSLSAGPYFYTLRAGDTRLTGQLFLLR